MWTSVFGLLLCTVALSISCIDDNSADAWLSSLSCEQLTAGSSNWCVDKTFAKQTQERCPLTCGKCTATPQPKPTPTAEDSFGDKLSKKYCTEDWGPANEAKTTEETKGECMARCLKDNTCQGITYANEVNQSYHKDCMLCIGTAVHGPSSGYDTYLRKVTPATPEPTPTPTVSCIDDNSADAWLPSYSCEELLGINWCVDKTYGKQTQERCPLTCGKCEKVLTCSDFGAVQECDSPNGGACQIGCDIARCDGGKCDQRFAKTCICNGATGTFADKSGGKYCTENWGPINVAKTKGGTLDECMDRCSNDNSCKAITYGNTINPAYHKDCMLCTGITVSRSSGYDTYIKGASTSTATSGEPGQCWQFGCSNPTCNSGTCGNDNTPPSGCVAPSCAGPNIDECAVKPCKNGGTCTDKVNGYECACESGYFGIDCEQDIDECAGNPCQNGGTCTDKVNGYECACEEGYMGIDCETALSPHPIELCKTSLQVLDNWPSKWGKEGQFFAFDSKCMDVFYGSSKWDWKKMMVSAPDGSEVKVVFFKNKAGGSNENVCGGTPCGRIDPKDNSASGDWPWGSYVNHIDYGLVPQTTEQCQSQLQITGIRPVDFEQEGKWFEFENDCMTAFFGTEYWGWKKFSITVNGETRKVAFFKNLEMCGMKSCGRVDPKAAAKAGDWSMGNVLVKTGDYDYYLVDGAPLNGILIPTKKTTNPNTQLAEVQCCKTDESDCTRRDPWNSSSNDDCISGNNDAAVKYNYFEAESLCQNIEPKGQWDLCQKELIESTNPRICQLKGCYIDQQLTWTKRITQDKDEQALNKESTVGSGTTQTSLRSHMSIATFLAICTLFGGVVVFRMMMKKEKSEESHPLLETI